MFTTKTTPGDMLSALRDSGGACMKMVFRDKEGKAMAAILVAEGQPETEEILQAVQKIEDSWE